MCCSAEEVQEFTQFAANPGAADIIYKKIAPAIFGHDDIKKAIACLLFGGTRKVCERERKCRALI